MKLLKGIIRQFKIVYYRMRMWIYEQKMKRAKTPAELARYYVLHDIFSTKLLIFYVQLNENKD